MKDGQGKREGEMRGGGESEKAGREKGTGGREEKNWEKWEGGKKRKILRACFPRREERDKGTRGGGG